MNASGEYYIVIDSDKCDGCEDCAKKCPKSVLEAVKMMVDIEERCLISVKEEYRNKLRYVCAQCMPEKTKPPCVATCEKNAIEWIWKSSR
ncbi:MAG: 4Fe-4S binding protein [Candidatus Bathyarchaeia archaeon]